MKTTLNPVYVLISLVFASLLCSCEKEDIDGDSIIHYYNFEVEIPGYTTYSEHLCSFDAGPHTIQININPDNESFILKKGGCKSFTIKDFYVIEQATSELERFKYSDFETEKATEIGIASVTKLNDESALVRIDSTQLRKYNSTLYISVSATPYAYKDSGKSKKETFKNPDVRNITIMAKIFRCN